MFIPITSEALQNSPSLYLARRMYGCDLVERLQNLAGTISFDLQHGHPVIFPPPRFSRPILLTRAPMGSGKTTALIAWLTDFLNTTDKSVIVISCRRSFTNSLVRRFHLSGLTSFTTYLQSNEYMLDVRSNRRLIVQLESLQRLSTSVAENYDVLVLDEVMSIMTQFFSSTVRRLRSIEAVFTKLIRDCKYIIAMDATTNISLVNLFVEFRGQENVHVIVNDYVSTGFVNRKCHVLRTLGTSIPAKILLEKTHEQTIAKATKTPTKTPTSAHEVSDDDSTISITCSSERRLDLIENFCTARDSANHTDITRVAIRHPDSPETIILPVSALYDRKSFFANLVYKLSMGQNICIFSSTLTFSEIIAAFCSRLLTKRKVLLVNSTTEREIEDVRQWRSFRVVIYTTVVTVGISFDEPHFHSLFAFVMPSIHGPDMMTVYQALGRVRVLLEDEIILYFDVSGAWGGPTFTPMLLNSVLSDSVREWSGELVSPADLMCIRFATRCADTLPEYENTIFARFKTKHYIERCTLTSANDSFSLLHTLLNNNRITVDLDMDDSVGVFNHEEFTKFMVSLRADCGTNRSDMRLLREYAFDKAMGASDTTVLTTLMEHVDVHDFIEKYLDLEHFIDPSVVLTVVRGLKNAQTTAWLVNAIFVTLCCLCPETEWKTYESEHFTTNHLNPTHLDKLLDHLTRGPFLMLIQGRTKSVYPAYGGISDSGRCDLLKMCVSMARELNWIPTIGSVELPIDKVVYAIRTALSKGISVPILQYLRLNITEPQWLTDSIIKLQRRLDGKCSISSSGLCKKVHTGEVAIFRRLWAELFGIRTVKSQRTFPGNTRVKNLRKNDIIRLLREIGIEVDGRETHKILYETLMKHKQQFQTPRLQLSCPEWMKYLRKTWPDCIPRISDE
ncbi:DNA replication origin-binding helicase [Psittacid alphaherpesvirus 5]|nr:DNA replication origin-binding helicase [Psittacid alphaherpesvirus 5]